MIAFVVVAVVVLHELGDDVDRHGEHYRRVLLCGNAVQRLQVAQLEVINISCVICSSLVFLAENNKDSSSNIAAEKLEKISTKLAKIRVFDWNNLKLGSSNR